MPKSKTARILDILEAAGQTGMRFTDIQRHLWEMNNPVGTFTRDLRGYWCTALLGGPHYHEGLLHVYASKGADGRWRRNKKAHGGRPWAGVQPGFFGWR